MIFSALRMYGGDYDSLITYDRLVVNIGNGMNIENGVFRAPFGGVYFFTFMATTGADNHEVKVSVRKNEVTQVVITDAGGSSYNSLSGSWMLVLEQNDEVYMNVDVGHLGQYYDWYTTFTGQLIQLPMK